MPRGHAGCCLSFRVVCIGLFSLLNPSWSEAIAGRRRHDGAGWRQMRRPPRRRNGVENAFWAVKNALALRRITFGPVHGSDTRAAVPQRQRSERDGGSAPPPAARRRPASRYDWSCWATLRCGAARAPHALPKKAQALLAYLAMQDGRPVPREQLAELLWGASGGEQARRSLRQCLMSVRAALKAGGDARADDRGRPHVTRRRLRDRGRCLSLRSACGLEEVR